MLSLRIHFSDLALARLERLQQSQEVCASEQLLRTLKIGRCICSWTALHEDNAIVVLRPIVDNLLYLQSRGC